MRSVKPNLRLYRHRNTRVRHLICGAIICTVALSFAFGVAGQSTAGNPDLVLTAMHSVEWAALNKAIADALVSSSVQPAGDWSKALNCAKELVAKYPEFGGAHSKLAFVYEQIGLSDEAIDAYQRAIRLDPSDGGSWQSLGSLL